jgi:hypothetical protein
MTSTISANIPITNHDAAAREVTIPAGTLIEVNTPGMQNVVVARTVTVTIQGKSTQSVHVEVYCVNRDLAYPKNAKGKLTTSTFAVPINEQSSVWTTMSQPAKPDQAAFTGLKQEMVNCLRSLRAFEMFVEDEMKILADDIPGDTISYKCFGLIRYCRQRGIVDALMKKLLLQFPHSPYLATWSPEPPVTV